MNYFLEPVQPVFFPADRAFEVSVLQRMRDIFGFEFKSQCGHSICMLFSFARSILPDNIGAGADGNQNAAVINEFRPGDGNLVSQS